MSREVAFQPLARREFDEAVAWYNRSSRGLGRRFGRAVQAVLDAAADNPERYPVSEQDEEIRCGLVTGFPYEVLYRILPDCIVVIGIYHQARDPEGWQGRG